MSTSDEIAVLVAKVEQLLALLEPLERQGDRKAALFADGVRHRLAALRKLAPNERSINLASRLGDIVPGAKALDDINFPDERHPAIAALRTDIEAEAAQLALRLMAAS